MSINDDWRPSVYVVIVMQMLLLSVLQFGEQILPSAFVARKACHAGSGLLMLLLDSNNFIARCFVYSVVASSLAMTWNLLPDWVSILLSAAHGRKHTSLVRWPAAASHTQRMQTQCPPGHAECARDLEASVVRHAGACQAANVPLWRHV